ncbi:MAG: anaerobic glycerol-3-phosphate dehydrogenase subunit GlpC, partial [Aeromonas veronii]
MLLDHANQTFDQCIKCTVCTAYCPVAKANPAYPGPKQAGPDGERLRIKSPELFDSALKHCTNCKRCEVACPSGVRIGDIIAKAKHQYSGFKPGIREFVLSHTDLMGSMSTLMAPVVNFTTGLKPMKLVLDKALGVSSHRDLPKYSQGTFRGWYKKQKESQARFARQIAYFHGCYVNYNHPQLGKELVQVLNAMNIGVQLLEREKCCGVPLIANGFMDKAKQQAAFNIK